MMSHSMLRAVFQAFDAGKIGWCVLRGEAELKAPSGDVDLLVAPGDMRRVCLILDDLGFVPLPAWGRGSHRFFLSYHPATDQWIELDVVTELAYGRYAALRTYAEADCLARRRRLGDVVALDRDDAFWTLLLHCLLDKGSFAARHIAPLQELVSEAQADGPLARMVNTICPPGWSPVRMIECVQRGEWTALGLVASALEAAWTRRDRVKAWRRTAINRIMHLLERPLMLRQRHGLSVALLGPDGVGKSTLTASLQGSFYFPVRSVYMGLWQRKARRVAWLHVPGWEIASRPFVIWGRYLKARFHQALGRLVIFDRYTYDALLPPSGSFIWLKRLYFWVLARMCPAPDLVFVLDAPGEVIYRRKDEYDTVHLEAERQQFLKMRERIPQIQVIDANRAADAVRIDVVNRIWQRYVVRLNPAKGNLAPQLSSDHIGSMVKR